MSRPRGKDTCDISFIHAFLKARDDCKRLGTTVQIEGYGGMKVSPIKKEDHDEN